MPLHIQHLNCDDSAPRRARIWVAEILRESITAGQRWRADMIDNAVLCVSELVTAALIAQSATMTVRLFVDEDFVRLSLVDDFPVTRDQQDPNLRAQRMGFRVVESVADGWGISPSGEGRELWATFRVDEVDAADR